MKKTHYLLKLLFLITIPFVVSYIGYTVSNSAKKLPNDIHKLLLPDQLELPRGVTNTSTLFLHPDVEQKDSIYRVWTRDTSHVSSPKFSVSVKDYNSLWLARRRFNSHSFVNSPRREIYLSDEDIQLYTSKLADQSAIMCVRGLVENCKWWAYRGRYSQYVVSVKLYYDSQEYTAEEFYSLITQIDAHIAQQLKETE